MEKLYRIKSKDAIVVLDEKGRPVATREVLDQFNENLVKMGFKPVY